MELTPTLILNPVSYTHLDVYKRQLRLSSFLFGSELVEGFRFCHWD